VTGGVYSSCCVQIVNNFLLPSVVASTSVSLPQCLQPGCGCKLHLLLIARFILTVPSSLLCLFISLPYCTTFFLICFLYSIIF
jgi:hypothetical protein